MKPITATPAQWLTALNYVRSKVLYQEESLYDLSLVREATEHGPVERWHAAITMPSGQIRSVSLDAASVATGSRYRNRSCDPWR